MFVDRKYSGFLFCFLGMSVFKNNHRDSVVPCYDVRLRFTCMKKDSEGALQDWSGEARVENNGRGELKIADDSRL